jgi:hypothetical protein
LFVFFVFASIKASQSGSEASSVGKSHTLWILALKALALVHKTETWKLDLFSSADAMCCSPQVFNL